MFKNPISGVKTLPIFNADGQVEKFVETQDGTRIDNAEKLARHQAEEAPSLVGNTQRHRRHVAEIPTVIVNDLMRRGIWGDDKALLRWIETEGQAFKSFAGRLV